jgi:hypothetical protein
MMQHTRSKQNVARGYSPRECEHASDHRLQPRLLLRTSGRQAKLRLAFASLATIVLEPRACVAFALCTFLLKVEREFEESQELTSSILFEI